MTSSPGPLPPYRLVATDLDGTLLRADQTISTRTHDALALATLAGAAHVVVTGRAVRRTRDVLSALGYKGLAVCGQGAQVYDLGEDRLLTSAVLEREVARTAVARIEARTGTLGLAVSQDGIDGQMLFGPGYIQQEGPPPTGVVADPDDLWWAPINKVYLYHPGLDDDELTRVADEAVDGLVTVVLAGKGVVELLPLGMSKATGLAFVAERLGIAAEHTVAFGDMPNDIPMLNWAGHGVAMGNAHAELRDVADEITASNEEDGVAVVLERLFQG